VVHERRLEGSNQAMELRVSGAVLHGKTNTRWLQETGKAIDGQKKGLRLAQLDAKKWTGNVRWDVWKKQHPDSQLLYCDHCENQLKQGDHDHEHDKDHKHD
jgi:SRSO17 transposase